MKTHTTIMQLAILLATSLATLLASCSPKTVPYPVETVRYERIEADTARFLALINSLEEEIRSKEHTTDSVVREHRRDVTVNEYGDTTKDKETVYVYISHKQEQEYERIINRQHDSISSLNAQLAVTKVDSVPVPYPVERKLTAWEKTKMDFGGMAIGGLIVALIAVVWLVFIKRRR